ncbi:RING-H2 finger protein ATL8-like [Phalaenopsis equestris]|uniref:RING-H2 finger protein ATL8-like n=1 Tax=Phalaenopsis equestris TaxID=78828 RepID=UPI0009E2290C|nr:RING-H2 finger protein ATL8-like [Phalaenopsis equestris]
MLLIPLLITAGIFFGIALTMLSLFYLLRRVRPSVHQSPPPRPPESTADDPNSVLNSIPVICHIKNEGIFECPVCLLSVEEGEKVRFLPDCGHGFHASCIDEWLCSRLTCPFCRSPVISSAKSSDTMSDAVSSNLAGLRTLLRIKLAYWRNMARGPSARDGDRSNGGGESGHEREESSSV